MSRYKRCELILPRIGGLVSSTGGGTDAAVDVGLVVVMSVVDGDAVVVGVGDIDGGGVVVAIVVNITVVCPSIGLSVDVAPYEVAIKLDSEFVIVARVNEMLDISDDRLSKFTVVIELDAIILVTKSDDDVDSCSVID